MMPNLRHFVAICCLGLLALDPWVTMFSHSHGGGANAGGSKEVVGAASKGCSHFHSGCGHHHHSKVAESAPSKERPATDDSGSHDDCAACRHQANVVACIGFEFSWESALVSQPLVIGEAISACPRLVFSYSSRGPPALGY